MAVTLRRSFLLGRSAGEAICQERRETLEVLIVHHRLLAQEAVKRGASTARKEYEAMRSLMYAGGLHMVRLYGGRSIDRR